MARADYLIIDHLPTAQLIRLFSKIEVLQDVTWNNSPCWIWCGFRNKLGYGLAKLSGRDESLHRLMYAWLIGAIPRGGHFGELDHLCRNPTCCNPIHLEFVSSRVNTLRGTCPAAKNARKTHCSQGHPFKGHNLMLDSKGRRKCRICHNERSRKTRRNKAGRLINVDYKNWRNRYDVMIS